MGMSKPTEIPEGLTETPIPKPKSSADLVNQDAERDKQVAKLSKQMEEISAAITTLRQPAPTPPEPTKKSETNIVTSLLQDLGILHKEG